MTRYTLIVLLLVLIIPANTVAQQSTEVYLLTCDPGTESYSMYGHSALRVVDTSQNIDIVYNWGVFDFSTPNFNYKFAKGRLDYMLGVYSYTDFLKEYAFYERAVFSQRVYLPEPELLMLLQMINENAKPENRYYRYDFFMDNCATRIRDLFETIYGIRMSYEDEPGEIYPTYRERLAEFLGAYPWLHMGIDLLIGSPGDDDCDLRGSMFLPDYLAQNLSLAVISDKSGDYPLLGKSVTVLEFERPGMEIPVYREAWFILTLVMLVILVLSFSARKRLLHNLFDIPFFIILSVLSILMLFTNFFTDHVAMGSNLNIIWLNPLWILSLYALFIPGRFKWLWKTEIMLTLLFMILIVLVKQSINPAFIPILLIIIIRSYYRLAFVTPESIATN